MNDERKTKAIARATALSRAILDATLENVHGNDDGDGDEHTRVTATAFCTAIEKITNEADPDFGAIVHDMLGQWLERRKM